MPVELGGRELLQCRQRNTCAARTTSASQSSAPPAEQNVLLVENNGFDWRRLICVNGRWLRSTSHTLSSPAANASTTPQSRGVRTNRLRCPTWTHRRIEFAREAPKRVGDYCAPSVDQRSMPGVLACMGLLPTSWLLWIPAGGGADHLDQVCLIPESRHGPTVCMYVAIHGKGGNDICCSDNLPPLDGRRQIRR